MVRPRKCRRIRFQAKAKYFKPQGIPMRGLSSVLLSKEELEALKLKDYDELPQNEAAEKMKTSQSTFQRILSSARKKVTKTIVLGKVLKIEE